MNLKLPLFNLLFWAAMGLFVLGTYSCSEPASPFGQTDLTLTALDASCTEVWLELKFSNLAQPANVAIQKDGKDYLRLLSLNRDTLLVFEDLEPSTNYSFRAIIRHEGKDDKISNTIPVRTMDTTSHNFTWQTFTFGEHSSSTFYDVAIINENNIWAVGEIYMKDSLGNPDPHAYNVVHWDGTNWELKKIYTGSSCNPVDYSPLKAIFAFSDSNIAITSGGSIGWFNGKINRADCGIRPLLSGSINKMWGSSSSDLYVVGNGGNIAHYNGTGWRKIESGTDVNLRDIWGSPDGNVVWICGRQDTKPTVLLKYSNNSIIKIIEDTENLYNYSGSVISGGINSIWTNDNKKVFVLTWFDLYRAATNTNGEARALWSGNPGNWGVEKIRANNINDFIASGVYSRIWHFNGVTWKRYEELVNQKDVLYGIDIKGNIVVSVGNRYYSGVEDYGLIHLGKR